MVTIEYALQMTDICGKLSGIKLCHQIVESNFYIKL